MMINILKFILVFIVCTSSAFADEKDNLEEKCLQEKARTILQKVGLSFDQAKIVYFESECSAKNLCFTLSNSELTVVNGYQIPPKAEFKLCANEGLRQISAKGNTSKGDLVCTDDIRFRGNHSMPCDCKLGKSYKLSIKHINKSESVSLPMNSLVSFTGDKISHFSPSENINYSDGKFLKNSYYELTDDVAKLSSQGNFPNCSVYDDSEESLLTQVLKDTGITKDDLDNISFNEKCEDESVEGSEKSISAKVKRTVYGKDFTIPQGSSVRFCRGKLFQIKAPSSGLINFLGRGCSTKVEADLDEKKYQCPSYTNFYMDGVLIPAGVSIVFNQDKIFCFGLFDSDIPEDMIPIVDGEKMKPGTYNVLKGKIVPSRCD